MRVALILLTCYLSVLSNAQRAGQRPAQRGVGQRQVYTPNGYLPPTPDDEMCFPTTSTAYVTSTSRVVATDYAEGPGGRVITSTYFTERVVPTTIFQTEVQTRFTTFSQIVTQTQSRDVTSTYVTTIGGIPVTTTATRTVTVPERIASTYYETVQDLKYVTSTYVDQAVTTVVQAVTSTTVRDRQVTQTVPVRGRDDTRTTTAVSRIVNTIETQAPPSTYVQTQSSASIIVSTTQIQPPPQVITQERTSTQFDYVTVTTTLRDFVTSTQRVTSTSVGVTTLRDERVQTVLSTNVIRQTSQVVVTSERVTTQLRPTTVYGTNVVTITESQPPIYRTSSVERFVTETRPGGFDIITNTVYSTTRVQITTTIRGGIQETITVTQTVKQTPCGTKGYKYDAPASPFNF